jgi:uncharacterized protein (TIGR02231 family)
MKTPTLFSLALVLFINSKAQNTDNVSVNAPVKSVILYLDGAEVSQNKNVALNSGRTLITFTGLSPKLISKSIQVTVSNDVTVLSVSDKINFLTENIESPRVKQLKDSMELLSDINSQLNYDLQAYNQEKAMLAKNESIGGQDKGVSIAELKLAADFYRARLKDINTETFKVQKKMDKNNLIIYRLQNEIDESGNKKLPTAEVSILVMSNLKTNATVDLKYVVKECGWAPSYDLITEDINKPIELKYRAKVYNNSGVDWADVKMKLSTADPMQSAAKPDLAAWYLNFSNLNFTGNKNYYGNNYYNDNNNAADKSGFANAPSVAQSQSLYDEEIQTKDVKKGNKQTVIQYEEVQVSELSAEFDIKQLYSVPSDAKPYLVDVTVYNLNAMFQYYSVPKVDKDAFMLAKITGWEDLDLVEGPANVYFGGTYVGQSYINTRSVDDTLSLSFGRDKKIVVSRTKLKDFNSEQVAGTTRKVMHSYEIIVKNNRKAPIQIELEDQLPVSQNSEIVVEVKEISKAEKNDLTGQLKWKLSLAPDETKKIVLTYTIKYPKNKSIDLQKRKAKMKAML